MSNRIVDFPDGYSSGTSPVITDPNLTAHLNDTTDAHDASAISNVPAGNLAATDVQGALNELQGDIDSLGSGAVEVAQDALAASFAAGAQDGATLTYNDAANKFDLTNTDKGSTAVSSHESDVTAHPASSIVNTPSGNLAATEVQAALNELQTDVDSRALSSALTSHTGASTAHGVSGNIVGTSDAQVITNKDIDGGTASNTSRITLPKASKTTLDGLTRKEATLVYASDTDKVYYDDGSTLKAVGSGSGGGINFMPLSTTWSSDNSDNVDAETSVGSWVTFADAAATTPVDLTAGSSAQLTLSRTTTAAELLNGAASFKLVKAAANAQGEGVSCTFNVPPAYQGKLCNIKIPYKITGTIATGDITVWIYDVTNSLLITPLAQNIDQASGALNAYFTTTPSAGTPANQNYRIGIYFGSTGTNAQTLYFDDVSVGPVDSVYGPNITAWQSYTPTFTGWGTVVTQSTRWRQNGDSIEIEGRFVAAGPTATEARLSLPNSLVSQSDYATLETAGFGATTNTGRSLSILIEPSVSYITFGGIDTTNGSLTKKNGNALLNAADVTAFFARVRVTSLQASTPAVIINPNIGPWHTYTPTFTGFGTVSTQSFRWRQVGESVEIAGRFLTGTTTATEARISLPNNYTSSSSYVTLEFAGGSVGNSTSVAGRTSHPLIEPSVQYITFGYGDNSVNQLSKTNGNGIAANATTLSVNATVRVQGLSAAGVINNPRSEVFLDTGNGSGSSSTGVRRFTNTRKNTGSAITYADSASLGATFTINESGIYSITYQDYSGGSDVLIGVTVNSANLTGAINSISYANGRRVWTYVRTGESQPVSWTGILERGDIIRAQHQSANSSDVGCNFSIVKVSN